MSPREISRIHANVCQVFANPFRIEIIEALSEREQSNEDLVEILHTSRPNLSQHIKLMRDRGLIESRQEDGKLLHRLSDPRIAQLFRLEREIMAGISGRASQIILNDHGPENGCGVLDKQL